MSGRALFAGYLVTIAFVLDGVVVCGIFYLYIKGITIDAAAFGSMTLFLGTIVGTVNTMAMQPVSWAFGSTVTSEKKTDTIQQMAGKG